MVVDAWLVDDFFLIDGNSSVSTAKYLYLIHSEYQCSTTISEERKLQF